MDPTKVATLKKKLLEATDLTEVLEYFFSEFGNDPRFARSGVPMRDDLTFLSALGQVIASVVGETIGVLHGTPVRVAEHRLRHGAFDFGKWTAMMFYFEDVDQGFLAIGDSGGADRFVRFSFIATPDGKPIQVH